MFWIYGDFFFFNFVSQYLVHIFRESPTSFLLRINSGIAQFSTKRHQKIRPNVSFYKDYQRTTQWVRFYEIGEFFLHLQADLFSLPLCELHH